MQSVKTLAKRLVLHQGVVVTRPLELTGAGKSVYF
jgi:hypothetical protein